MLGLTSTATEASYGVLQTTGVGRGRGGGSGRWWGGAAGGGGGYLCNVRPKRSDPQNQERPQPRKQNIKVVGNSPVQ